MGSIFKYATESDLRNVFPDFNNYAPRTLIKDGWEAQSGSRYAISDIGMVVEQVWFDEVKGIEQANTSITTTNGWYYDSGGDTLWVKCSNPEEEVNVQVGDDSMTQALVNASMEVSGMLDGRYPRPIPKSFQIINDIDTDATESPEYDYLLIRATCLLTAKNLIRSIDATSELAQAYYSEVTNELGTGIVDKLNAGEYKLAFEIDRTDSSGDIVDGSSSGSMKLVETWGEYSGSLYDKIKIECTTLGVYGTAKVDISTLNGEQLYGSTQSNIVVTGGLQSMGGIYCRFEGNTLKEGDIWYVIVRNAGMKPSTSNAYSVGLSRR